MLKLCGENYERPVVHDKYTLSVHTKRLNWRLMLYFAGSMTIYPADEIRIPGDVYLDEFNWKMITGTGPYILKPEDIKQEQSLTLTRRADYWAKDDPDSLYVNNFDRITFIVVRDSELAFEMFKKGELDYFKVMRSQRWVEECNFDKIEKGWIQKRKIYNEQPQGYAGYCFNMRTAPFDDKRVRLAFCYAFNRERLFEKLFFNEYEYVDSYWPGGPWGKPDNRKIRFNPRRAERLLAQAGYTRRNADGVRVHDETGAPLEFTLEYWSPGSDRYHRIVAEDLQKIGFKMNLKLVDRTSLVKRVGERKFTVHFQNWRSIIFPNPVTSWHSDLADKLDNNNLPGFASARVDELMDLYDRTLQREKQIAIIREMDGIIFREHPYALAWFAPFERILHWNRFGTIDTYLTRFTDERAIWSYWWLDAEKDRALREAMKKDAALPVGEITVDPWGVKARIDLEKGTGSTPQ
ncbi:MAG: ABC transporter substrate-binding protein, partial [Planctomycetota bacterium]